MFGKKGQTATEYLIILAVVIIVAIVTVVVMGGFLTLGGTTSVRTSETYWKASDIAMPSFSVSSGSLSKFIFKSNLNDAILIYNISFSSDDVNYYGVLATPTTLTTGKTFSVSPNFTSSSDLADLRCYSPGDGFSYYLKIDYLNKATGITYNFTGDKNVIKGACGN